LPRNTNIRITCLLLCSSFNFLYVSDRYFDLSNINLKAKKGGKFFPILRLSLIEGPLLDVGRRDSSCPMVCNLYMAPVEMEDEVGL
jgi:hypothetical protein